MSVTLGLNKLTIGSSQLGTIAGSAPSYTIRAFCRFNGTGTPSIKASGNVSSITDDGVGTYRMNLSTGMPDYNWVMVGNAVADPNGAAYDIRTNVTHRLAYSAYNVVPFWVTWGTQNTTTIDSNAIGILVLR